MKTLLRNTAIYMYALFVLPKLIPGVEVDGGFLTFLLGGIALAIMFFVIKPILNIISFPVNILTLGLFTLVNNALVVYLLTIFFTDISVSAFTYQKAQWGGFAIPDIAFNTFFAYIYAAIVLSLIYQVVEWVRK
jgi:putative membrane protein